MFDRMWRSIGLMLGALALAAALASPGISRPFQRIIAIGDLHGDYAAYHAIMRAAGLIDERDRWAGGETILVQTGDIVDRGPDSLRIIRHLMRLAREARRAGGRVVTLVGNHEAMNVTGDLRYVHLGEFAALVDGRSDERRERVYRLNREAIENFYRTNDPAMTGEAIRQAWIEATPLGEVEHQAAWLPEGELGRWAAGNPAVVLIGGTLFAHGGISAAYADLPIEEINRRVAAALASRDAAPEAIINDPLGPLWYRGLVAHDVVGNPETLAAPEVSRMPRPSIAQEIDMALRAYGARRIVVGHTPMPDGIAVLHGGRLIAIDTGISEHYDGRLSYLEIVGERAVAHVVDEERGR